MTTTIEQEIVLTAAKVEIAAGEAQKQPAVSIVAYTGGIMRVGGWGDIAINLAGLDCGGAIPLLVDHDPGLDNVLGKGEAKVLIGQLHVAGNIVGSTAAAKKVLDLARDGFPLQASVGVAPEETTRIAPGDKVEINGRTVVAPKGGLTVVAKGKLREVSVVTMGCDSRTSVAIAASQGVGDDDVLTTERVRVASIMKLTVKHPEIAAKAVSEGWDSTKTELEVLRASRPKAPTTWVPASFVANSTVIEASLLSRMGYRAMAEKTLGAEAMERAEGLRANSLVDLCRAALLAEHQDIPNNRMELVKAAVSTISLPTALGDTAHKILLNAYNESPATWKAFCAVVNVSDFRTAKAIRPTFVGELEELPPGGEFKHDSITEAVTDIQAKTFGKMLSIDRRDIMNDDLSLFNTTADALGRAAMRALSDLVYSTLLSNTNAFFGAPNGNYISGADSVLSVDSLGRAIALMLAQKDASNRNLDIRPVTLLVPPEQYQTAKMLLESDLIQRAANTPMGNPLKNAVQLGVEPRLSNTARFTGASDKGWYLFATPSDAALIVCFLNGVQSPTVEFFGLNSDVNTLAMSWRVYFDFGCGFGDYRAAVLSTGQA